MTVRTRRVWRVSTGTLVAVWVFVVVAGLGVPTLAVLAYLRAGDLLISIFLAVLAAAAVVYGWRFGLHPRLIAGPRGRPGDQPRTTHRDRVGRPDGDRHRARTGWSSVPRSHGPRPGASRSPGRRRRRGGAPGRIGSWPSSRTCRTEFDPPLEDEQTGIRIRRARQSDLDLLTSLERAASEANLKHVFDP